MPGAGAAFSAPRHFEMIPGFFRVWFSPPFVYVAMPWWLWVGLIALVTLLFFRFRVRSL